MNTENRKQESGIRKQPKHLLSPADCLLPPSSQRGMMLVASIVLLIFTGVFGVVASSIVGTVAGGTATEGLDAKALGLAQAGHQWYMKQLDEDANWADNTNYTVTNNYGNGTFRIDVLSASEAEVQFKSTGSITSPFDTGVNVQRWMKQTVQRPAVTVWPQAFNYALYSGVSQGTALHVGYFERSNKQNPVNLYGDAYSRDGVIVEQGSTYGTGLGDIFDYPAGTSFQCNGTCNGISNQLSSPLTNPSFDNAPYLTKKTIYDSAMNSADCVGSCQTVTLSSGTLDINTDTTYCSNNCPAGISGRCCRFNYFETNGDVIIRGEGAIITTNATGGNIRLHSGASGMNRLRVIPDVGKEILFLSRAGIFVGNYNYASSPDAYGSQSVTINQDTITGGSDAIGRVTLYAYIQTGFGKEIAIIGHTSIYDALIYGPIIQVNKGPVIYGTDSWDAGSILYAAYAIQISRDVGSPGAISASLISLGTSNTAFYSITATNGEPDPTAIAGIIFVPNGGCIFDQLYIYGSAVCHHYYSYSGITNAVTNTTLEYNPTYLPQEIPPGIGGSGAGAIEKPATWDGE